MSKSRFLIVDTADGIRYTVNIDYIIAFREDVTKPEKGGVLYVADAKSDGSRLVLDISSEEAESIRQWLYRQ